MDISARCFEAHFFFLYAHSRFLSQEPDFSLFVAHEISAKSFYWKGKKKKGKKNRTNNSVQKPAEMPVDGEHLAHCSPTSFVGETVIVISAQAQACDSNGNE